MHLLANVPHFRVSNGTGQYNFSGQRDKLKIYPRDGTGRDGIFDKLSRPVPGRPGTIPILFYYTFQENKFDFYA